MRITAATRLFHKGVDEQLIMERTGHRSLDGVRTYKRPCKEQHKELSNVLHGSEKRVKTEEKEINVVPRNKMSTHDTTKPVFNFSGCNGITINYIQLLSSFI